MAQNGLKRMSTHEERDVSPPPLKRAKPSGTTQKAVANFFTPTSQKEAIPGKVTCRIEQGSLIFISNATTPTDTEARHGLVKIAGFDFDSTLIKTSSGNAFGRDANDWTWWDVIVPSKLRSLHTDGYKVVVFSNQSGISLASDSKSLKQDKKRFADFKAKAAAIISQLDIPVSIYAATAKDHFRKPRTGMWEALLSTHQIPASSVDLEHSFFVGDAGGRVANSQGRKKDFSCSDRDFASNLGIDFHTPEEFFLGEPAEAFSRDFDPAEYLSSGSGSGSSMDMEPPKFAKTNKLDIVLFCGSPGAGKSTFYWESLQPLGYERVNQDILKSRDRCLKVAQAFLEEGTSVAIDNTNADKQTRAYWTGLAQKLGVPIRCVLFTTSPKLAEHNDAVRALNGVATNPEKRIMLPKMAFTGFTSRYQEPTLDEGLQDITKVDFRFSGTDEQKSIWAKYWI